MPAGLKGAYLSSHTCGIQEVLDSTEVLKNARFKTSTHELW